MLQRPEVSEILGKFAKAGISIWRDGSRLRGAALQGVEAAGLPGMAADLKDTPLEFLHSEHPGNECLAPLYMNRHSIGAVICVHPGHGGIYDYRHLAAATSPSVEVYGLHALSILLARHPAPTVELMAAKYVRELLDSGLTDKPFAVYGASSGGFVALEVAQRLRAIGRTPALLVLGDTRNQRNWLKVSRVIQERIEWVAFLEVYLPEELLELAPATHEFWTLDRDARYSYLASRIRALKPAIRTIPGDSQSLREYFAAYQKYMSGYGLYAPLPYAGRSLYLKASIVDWAGSSDVRELLTGRTRLIEIDGSHAGQLKPPASSEVARLIEAEFFDELGAPGQPPSGKKEGESVSDQ
jgi:thioesterase domain-containing protein